MIEQTDEQTPAYRKAGSVAGQIRMSTDFSAPLKDLGLTLLGVTENYLMEKAQINLSVIANQKDK